jgi:predicted acyl esterase
MLVMRAYAFIIFSVLIFCSRTSVQAEELKPDMTVMIPMRDGTELPTDIYLPHPHARDLPCVLLRGPAGRHSASGTYYAKLTKEGYVVAIQDSRSFIDREGKTLPFVTDGWGKEQDGYDTVEWLAKNYLTNGKIGTLGSSNMGITQLLLAPTAPPALKCQYVGVAAASLYHHAAYPGGELLKNQVEGWLGYYARHPQVLKQVVDQPRYNEFWECVNSSKVANQVVAPALHQGGWYDIFLQGTIDAFVARQNEGGTGAKGNQKLLIGPWVHRWPASFEFGDFEIPMQGRHPPYDTSPERWFAFYLKGISNEVNDIAPVTYYVMGPFDGSASSGNVWRTADSWPIPHTNKLLYLTADHHLSEQTPSKEQIMAYTHDPKDPVPTIGGRNLFLAAGPMDQSAIEKRSDVVVFTTPPLEEDQEVTGHLCAKLYFSHPTEDGDIAVRLTDVYPDGRSVLVSDAIYRTGIMNPFKKIDEETGETIYEADLDLWSTSLVFAKGHRIRLSISGSNYPRYEMSRAKNEQDEEKAVKHRLYVGKKYPSQLILPYVKSTNASQIIQVAERTLTEGG